MLYRLFTVAAFCFLTETLFAGPFAAANQAEVDYGRGVHAFFAKDYQEALGFFQQAEKLESRDPRPYYYAGLTYKRLKQEQKSGEYYKKAASLEFGENIKREYDVSESLYRIQGRERLTIEKYREEARAKWQAEEKKRNEVKFNEQKARETQIVESFVKSNPQQDAKVLQALTQPADFGAKPIEPLKPDPVSKVLPRKEFTPAKNPAEAEPAEAEDKPAEDEKPETAKTNDADENPFAVNKKTADDDVDENPFAEGLKNAFDDEEESADKESKEKPKDESEKKAGEDEDADGEESADKKSQEKSKDESEKKASEDDSEEKTEKEPASAEK
jgi:hypothetical protein